MANYAGILAFPLFGGLIYAGYSEWNFFVSVLVGALGGSIIYVLTKGRLFLAKAVERSAVGAVSSIAIGQLVTAAIFYGLGYMFS